MARVNVKETLANATHVGYYPAALDFIDMYQFPLELIESVVRKPSDISLDPRSHEVDYPILRVRRGDIVLSVSLRDLKNPYVMFIHLVTPDEHTVASGSTGGIKGQGKTPTSPTELQAWFRRAGCNLENSAEGVKVTYKGYRVGVIHLTTHQRGGSQKSIFSRMVRSLRQIQGKIAADSIKEE